MTTAFLPDLSIITKHVMLGVGATILVSGGKAKEYRKADFHAKNNNQPRTLYFQIYLYMQ